MNTTLPPAHQTVPVMPHPAATVHTAQMMLGTITRICLSQKETGQRQMVEIVQGSEHTWVQIQDPALKIGQLVRINRSNGQAIHLPTVIGVEDLLVLYQKAVDPEHLDRLLWLVSGIKHKALRQFMAEILADQALAAQLVSLPASCRHHHSHPGGLLQHTVECGEWVQMMAPALLPEPEAALTLVVTLCHDLGKTRTLTSGNTITDTGRFVSHEIMGLQILQPFLDRLHHRWAKGADVLMHMLSWKPSKQEPLPRLPGLVMLRHVDQLSTVMNLRAQAFEGYPAYFYWNKPDQVITQRFHRIA